MTKEERKTLLAAAIALNLPPATWRDVLKVNSTPETTPEELAAGEAQMDALNHYFANFAPHQKNDKGEPICLCCRKRFPSNELAGALGVCETSNEWSLTHGEAHCRHCGWPSRVYHYDLANDKGEVMFPGRAVFSLQYHPSGMSLREDGA